jgi:hypothetical protein
MYYKLHTVNLHISKKGWLTLSAIIIETHMPDEQLFTKISLYLVKGKSEEEIRSKLISEGFVLEDINGALARYKIQNSAIGFKSHIPAPSASTRSRSGGSFLSSLILILLILLSSPAIYGFATSVVVPTLQGKPIQVSQSLTPYTTVSDAAFGTPPPLVISKGKPVEYRSISNTKTSAKNPQPVSPASGNVVVGTPTYVPSPTPTPTPTMVPAPTPAPTPAPVPTPDPSISPPVPIPTPTPTPTPSPVPVTPPSGVTATATDTPSFLKALAIAKAGDTISLATGLYSGLSREKNLNAPGTVYITSADTAHPATFNDLSINGCSNLTFNNLEFSTVPHTAGYVFIFSNCSNLHLLNLHVHGSLDGDSSNDANGFVFTHVTDSSLENSNIEQLGRGIVENNATNFVINNNHIHDLRSDGIDNAETGPLTISNNSIENFSPSATDHPDGIQFFTSGSTHSSHDITITNNTLRRGTGAGMQGIFMRDESGGSYPYVNVIISGNHLTGTGYRGISLGNGKNVTVTDNVLVSYFGNTNKNLIYFSSIDGMVSHNNVALLPISYINVTNLTESGNATNTPITDPLALVTPLSLLASVYQSTAFVSELISNIFTHILQLDF